VTRAISLILALGGCLGPLTGDQPAPSGQLLPAGSSVPSADDDPVLAVRMRAHQFVPPVVPLYSGFTGGAPIGVWDFGPVGPYTSPMFVLVDVYGAPIAHPEIVDFVPGDDHYTPFWTVWTVRVTDAYRGELVTSVAALDDALRLGLVESPVATAKGEHGPIVTSDVILSRPDAAPITAGDIFYYRGETVAYFDLGEVLLAPDRVTVPHGSRYLLRREGGEPLNEVVRQVDMDGDHDALDTNDIFAGVTPVFQTVDLVVPASTASIDTTHDQTRAAIEDDIQLFDPSPTPLVVSFSALGELRDFAFESAVDKR
jgi:hypothetical protein